MKLSPGVRRSILNRMACRFGILIEHSWRIALRKGTTSPFTEKSPDGKLGALAKRF